MAVPSARSLQPGDIVRVRGERWRVVHVASHEACTVVDLAGTGASNRGVTGRFLLPFEPADRLPAATERPRVVRPAVLRAVARRALAGATPSWPALAAAARAHVHLLPYQLEPALAVTRGLACRLLLADEVGLGKTIQAGLMLAEVLARERDARALIVTPAGLRDQWREELLERFGIDSAVLDAGGLARAAARLPSGVNPWAIPPVVITSVDFVKRPDVMRALEPLVWDLVAFDEAHTLAGRSDRAAAAELIARRGRRVVAITATPHNGDDRAFERLCALGRIDGDETMLMFRRSRAEAGITRTRTVRLLRIGPTPEERALHGALDAYARRVWRDAPSASAGEARLAMIVLARRACSSATSLARSVERRMALLEATAVDAAAQLPLPLGDDPMPEDDEPGAELAAPGLPDADVERRWLERILALARLASFRESKIAAVTRLLRRAREPAIVFTEYRDTLERLAAALPGGLAAPRLHGGLTPAERAAAARRFTHGDASLLLATDAASEGLNLHQRCRLAVNLEVPWTPVRLEQRTGRVDRLGQSRRVHALAFVARGTAEESVVRGLSVRLGRADRGAPFDGLGDASPAGLEVVSLRSEAAAEAERLNGFRRLGVPALVDERPVISVLRTGQGLLCWALRLLFVDAAGCVVWHTIVAPACRPGAASRGAANLRRWLAEIEVSAAVPIAAGTRSAHLDLLDRLRADLTAWANPLIGRERAMLGAIRERDARLAAGLFQPGLFDGRALRAAETQRALVEAAAARAEERIHALDVLAHPAAGDRQLLFIVAP